jgi:hypothetical protein
MSHAAHALTRSRPQGEWLARFDVREPAAELGLVVVVEPAGRLLRQQRRPTQWRIRPDARGVNSPGSRG